MGHKIFISYKYHDDDVEDLYNVFGITTARDYTDVLEEKIKNSNIYKGEEDNEDLSGLSEDTIKKKLYDRIYDSSLTIVLISPNMFDSSKKEKEQWIPREVSYSLTENSRKNESGDCITSRTNAMLAVVLPNKNGKYDYFIRENSCCATPCTGYDRSILPNIISSNMFNSKVSNKYNCGNGSTVWYGEASYIKPVKWCVFVDDIDKYIEESYDRKEHIEDYDITKELDK